ncbi:peptidoglycan hydrolase-like protein with peptidoglycan-binding domain [Allocatelliglobosispora scoriae]|uniref:Peptidoglycan hydrolase-like protein with peptidoglycan-binding domain n=1 Tax=Allocatelliglobosispora scoriae TaxID=643052 RepID=A0A841BM68_9ACTN|nr:peptidoglycan-binding domain-containing protein [Allocatelliglobosispora scoriae]MBB5868289.1 peptidoglycan hydrolase-like protein with peptidoglycan-binding domain [Allocatelliglobosispora scoriae]
MLGVAMAVALAGSIAVGTGTPAAAGVTPQCTIRWNVLPAGASGGIWMPYAEAAETTVCFMHRGSYSWGVWALQKALRVCYNKSIGTDLSFGPQTEQALREVQSLIHANPDGGYGPETRGKLKFVSVAYPDDPGACSTVN